MAIARTVLQDIVAGLRGWPSLAIASMAMVACSSGAPTTNNGNDAAPGAGEDAGGSEVVPDAAGTDSGTTPRVDAAPDVSSSATDGPVVACSMLTVPGTAAIFDADQPMSTLSGSTLPPMFAIDVTSGVLGLAVSSVTGTVDCCGGTPTTGPDGSSEYATELTSLNGIAGIEAPTSMFLVGVFTDGSVPSGTGPASLDFDSDGLGTNFTTLSPLLNQTFFIGDGLTGTGTGTQQQFIVPGGATQLFFGFADGNGFGGAPGSYQDNTGSFTVSFCVGDVAP
jgi:hypothetical protein